MSASAVILDIFKFITGDGKFVKKSECELIHRTVVSSETFHQTHDEIKEHVSEKIKELNVKLDATNTEVMKRFDTLNHDLLEIVKGVKWRNNGTGG